MDPFGFCIRSTQLARVVLSRFSQCRNAKTILFVEPKHQLSFNLRQRCGPLVCASDNFTYKSIKFSFRKFIDTV